MASSVDTVTHHISTVITEAIKTEVSRAVKQAVETVRAEQQEMESKKRKDRDERVDAFINKVRRTFDRLIDEMQTLKGEVETPARSV